MSDPIREVFQAVEAAKITGRPEKNDAQPDSGFVERPVNSLPQSSWTARDLLQHDFRNRGTRYRVCSPRA